MHAKRTCKCLERLLCVSLYRCIAKLNVKTSDPLLGRLEQMFDLISNPTAQKVVTTAAAWITNALFKKSKTYYLYLIDEITHKVSFPATETCIIDIYAGRLRYRRCGFNAVCPSHPTFRVSVLEYLKIAVAFFWTHQAYQTRGR